MQIERFETSPKLSKAVVYGGISYLAGQVADNLDGDIISQTKETLAKIDSLLAITGTSKERILSAQVWMTNMSDAKMMNDVWCEWMPEGQSPARACVEANLASPKHLVEIKVMAAL